MAPKKKTIDQRLVTSGKTRVRVDVWSGKIPGSQAIAYFIDAPRFFGSPKIYNAKPDDSRRFLFFSLAALEVLPELGFKPDIIHCHDMHTGLVPDLLAQRRAEAFFADMKILYTIHNLNYQGISGLRTLYTGNLDKESTKILSKDARDGDINFMVQGILGADLINTVSRTYAKEIKTSIYGASLENVVRLRKNDISGILNGIDTDLFNPAKDKLIAFQYAHSSLGRKAKNKKHLQTKLGLEQDQKVPLVGLVTRLCRQKGLDLITERIMDLPIQLVIVGSGDKDIEKKLSSLARNYKKRMSVTPKFDLDLAQEIYAGADILLVPSRFEPCGLTQMIAMRYGTVPVVRATGGLKDTVDTSVGFRFNEMSEGAMIKALARSAKLYSADPDKWRQLQQTGMSRDFSWKKPAQEYINLYKKLDAQK